MLPGAIAGLSKQSGWVKHQPFNVRWLAGSQEVFWAGVEPSYALISLANHNDATEASIGGFFLFIGFVSNFCPFPFQVQDRVPPEVVRCLAPRGLREHRCRLRLQLQLVGARVHQVSRQDPGEPQGQQKDHFHRYPEQVRLTRIGFLQAKGWAHPFLTLNFGWIVWIFWT